MWVCVELGGGGVRPAAGKITIMSEVFSLLFTDACVFNVVMLHTS